MALTADQRLAAIAPKFNANTNRAAYLEMAAERISLGIYGPTKYDMAVALRAAHDMELDSRSMGASGPIQGMTEGQLSIQFATSTNARADDDLSQTSYGRKLLSLRKGLVLGMVVASGDAPPGYAPEDLFRPRDY